MTFSRFIQIAFLSLWVSHQASANECLSQMPASVVATAQVKICKSSYTGLKQNYSCQDYSNGSENYRVIYKGGLEPKAIIQLSANGDEKLIWSPSFGDHNMRCPLPAPESIPKHARHRGMGVCIGDDDKPIPCSIFEHAQARVSEAWRYLVFYHPDGHTELVHKMVAGKNQNAMVAEIAYQLGLSLLDTHCCSEQATAYLEYAHRLFPRVSVYRSGYLDALAQLATSQQH